MAKPRADLSRADLVAGDVNPAVRTGAGRHS